MGMYTELVLKCQIKTDAPREVHVMLEWLFGDRGRVEEWETLPDHPFFSCPRWNMVGVLGSYYHYPTAFSETAGRTIFSRSDLKNYDNEIELFLDWAKPYIEPICGNCLGWIWYEEWDKPELIMVEP